MEIDQRSIFKIFEKNFAYSFEDTAVGKAIKMDAINAFHFANITGAGYLDDPTYPFSPKGVLKILREAFQYNIVTGIFDRQFLFYSPTELMQSKNYLFEGYKYVIPVQCMNESEFREKMQSAYNLLMAKGIEPTDYIFFRIEGWKNGNGMECFLEYIACELFRTRGYIVENQIPLVHSVGSPDFGGFHIKGNKQGFHIADLAMLRITRNFHYLNDLEIDHVIVGEAKTSTTIMAGQLEKYLNTTAFKKGYEMHPEKPNATKDCFGMLNISSDYSIRCQEPTSSYNNRGTIIFDFNEYMEWYANNLKLYIISNLTNDELRDYIQAQKASGKYSQQKIIDVVRNTSINEISKYVREVI